MDIAHWFKGSADETRGYGLKASRGFGNRAKGAALRSKGYAQKNYARLPTRYDILHSMGLETRKETWEYVLPALGIFGAGMMLGAGLGLLFAPKRGEETREELARRVRAKSEKDYARGRQYGSTPEVTVTGP